MNIPIAQVLYTGITTSQRRLSKLSIKTKTAQTASTDAAHVHDRKQDHKHDGTHDDQTAATHAHDHNHEHTHQQQQEPASNLKHNNGKETDTTTTTTTTTPTNTSTSTSTSASTASAPISNATAQQTKKEHKLATHQQESERDSKHEHGDEQDHGKHESSSNGSEIESNTADEKDPPTGFTSKQEMDSRLLKLEGILGKTISLHVQHVGDREAEEPAGPWDLLGKERGGKASFTVDAFGEIDMSTYSRRMLPELGMGKSVAYVAHRRSLAASYTLGITTISTKVGV